MSAPINSVRLSLEQQANVVAMYTSGLTIKAVSQRIGTCVATVSKVLKSKGIVIRGEGVDEATRKAVVNDYLNGMSFVDIYAKYGYTFGYVKKMMKQEGVNSRPCVLHSIDETFFDQIDSHEKAYWVGLIMADGCVLWNRPKTKINKLAISLTEADSYLLDDFAAQTRYTGEIRRWEYENNDQCNRQPARMLGIYNERFVDPLTRYGLSPNKSIINPFFSNIPDEYLPSAILGYFDGDGSVSFHAKDSNRLSASFIGSVEFSTQLRETLIRAGIKCSMRIRHTKSGYEMGEVRLKGNRSCLTLYQYMYQGNITSLKRKRDKFEWVLEQQRLGLIADTSVKEKV